MKKQNVYERARRLQQRQRHHDQVTLIGFTQALFGFCSLCEQHYVQIYGTKNRKSVIKQDIAYLCLDFTSDVYIFLHTKMVFLL